MKIKILIAGLLLTCSFSLQAQYLIVSRSATIKEHPQGDSEIIERVSKGEYLTLLNNGKQKNGYYKVESKSVNKEGWIYRTLVRRYEGNIPQPLSTKLNLTFDPIPSDYYSGTLNLEGDSLKDALHQIIKEHKEYSYGNVWDILKETDIDTQNISNVIGIYSGFSMKADDEYDGGKGWNREHVWAKSYGDFGTTMGAGTDLHHIRAEDVSTNSARNNRTFSEAEKLYVDTSGTYHGETSSNTSDTAWIWEPRDEVKGDVARMIFYMVVRYEGENEPDLELTDSLKSKNSKTPNHGKKSVLINWHKIDPVSNYERYRNHIIYKKYQRNRNPFIDHPEFVTKIWGE
jgi:endonuclease I